MTETLFLAPDFLSRTNIYEVNIRQYTPEGTFNAFAAHLPRLKSMGVEILWLMPIHPIGKIKRKGTLGSYYSIRDHRAVNPEFGTEEDLNSLIAKAHALEMKIILDWVANHTAWDHVWTNTNPDFFVRDAAGNFTPPFDWDDVIQIDHSNKGEQDAMQQAMSFWVSHFDIDGFRADLAHLTPLQFWKDARLKISPLKKDLVWLAETEEIGYHEAFDISYTWEWMHATEKFSRKEISLRDCVNLLQKYHEDFPVHALRMFFTSNHDENSWNGTEYEKYGALAKAWAVFSFTYSGVPLMYSGQEMPNRKRLKFFDKDEIDWRSNIELQQFYETLTSLRKRNKAINACAANDVHFFDELIEKNILAYKIAAGDDELLVFLNLGDIRAEENISLQSAGKYRDIFTNDITETGETFLFAAEAGEFRVFIKQHPADG